MMNRIRQERAGIHATQSELASKLSVTRTTIRKWESGLTTIPSNQINKLCDLFDCSADWLLNRSDKRSPAS